MIPVVILAGGKGTRLQELTGETPKPMLLVGGIPILQHIINRFRSCGFREFYIPVGYLGKHIFQYFRGNYEIVNEEVGVLEVSDENETKIIVVETGEDTLTGGRLLRLKKYLKDTPFMMTYGDGMSNINPKYVKEFGEELNKNIITAVHPPARFGSLIINPKMEVESFTEKIISPHDWINGGYFYLKPEVFNYIKNDGYNFEVDVLPKIVWDSGLYAFQYEGLWHCIDTLRVSKNVSRFGSLIINPKMEVESFTEKIISPHDWINGGYFYLKPEVFNYIKNDGYNFEVDVLPKIVWDSGLYAFQYEGLWHCIDTLRDLQLANEMCERGEFK